MTELAAWYQKKIGTYDKEEWETTIEQRIVQGLRQTPLKSTKLQPDLIDIDLVRGSSFPKAKPVQGVSTIVRLALARVLLFPFWYRWWAAHTSSLTTRLFLVCWILQVANTICYLIAPASVNLDVSCILVPLFLIAGLGVVHAFIVSTAHPHPINHRCRSLNHERKRSCLLTAKDESEIFKSANNIPEPIPVNKSTQTEDYCFDMKDKMDGLQIPKLSLTPPTSQSVKFNLEGASSARRKSLDDDVSSPLCRRRRTNVNLRLARFSVDGDDGFESLNGNNSNGSENGDDDDVSKKVPNAKCDKTEMKQMKGSVGIKYYDWHNGDTKDSGTNYESVVSANGGTNTVRFRPCSDGGSSTNLSGDLGHCESDEWYEHWLKVIDKHGSRSECRGRKTRKDRGTHIASSSEEECETASPPPGAQSQNTDFAQTTNSEDCSYCSEPESESEGLEGDSAWEPFTILNPASDRVSCTIWENGRILKIPMSVIEISHAVVRRSELALHVSDGGLWTGTIMAAILASIPPMTRLLQILIESGNDQVTVWDLPMIFITNSPFYLLCAAFGASSWERIINLISTILRLGCGALIFFLLAVAQRAFNQRFFYAKLFSHLTSARRARQSSLPHFRLNRVRNIKAWLSIRSYLMRRGPQRSVDIIVSAAFLLLVLLISFLVVDLLQDQNQGDLARTAETFGWTLALGTVLLKLVTLGTRASRKHKCLPVLLTEQINLHLAMERRPASKERLSVANNVLKLAADLLKELESPFKISGLSANPYLYTITKVVVLSALSGVLSEILGFKLKLHKIKIK